VLNLWKPWYVYRPRQILTRLVRAVRPTPTQPITVTLPWGVDIPADLRTPLGQALWTAGIYDLAVSELLYRLTSPGAVAYDAGANVGYMTSILAVRAGPTGRVRAFEPHPKALDLLRQTVSGLASNPQSAPVEIVPAALTDQPGRARLATAGGAEADTEVAHLTTDPMVAGIMVETHRLDDMVGNGRIDVMKMDVEGHEAAVLRGGERLLARQGIRHLVFEEHHAETSEAIGLLRKAGYTLFQIGWRMSGPVLADLTATRVFNPYEPPNYLATTDPDGAITICRQSGWRLLG
jgi:FkbM family methyltransferase